MWEVRNGISSSEEALCSAINSLCGTLTQLLRQREWDSGHDAVKKTKMGYHSDNTVHRKDIQTIPQY